MSDQSASGSDVSEVFDYVVRLEREADRLRRSRRVYRNILLIYIGLAAIFLIVRGVLVRDRLRMPVYPDSDIARPAEINNSPPTFPVKPLEIHENTIQSRAMSNPRVQANEDPTVPPNGGIDVQWDRLVTDFPWEMTYFVIGIGVFVMVGVRRATAAQKNAGRSLSTIDDIRATGPLIEVLMVDDTAVRNLARSSLRILLPRLRASDIGLLNDQRHRLLHKELRTKDSGWATLILRALEQVGDGRDVQMVVRIATDVFSARGSREVRQAAEDCLKFLFQREQDDRMRSTLLRPFGYDPVNNLTLLRPASDAQDIDAMLLLRSVEHD
jgi:hypothetical protein